MPKLTETLDRAALAKQEFEGVKLGDPRRGARLQQIVAAVAASPDTSLPQTMCGEAALEATYRFLGNDAVLASAVLEPHLQCTQKRTEQAGRAVVALDTTELRFGGTRKHLGFLTHKEGSSRGLFAHVGLAIDLEHGEPLGVLHLETWARKKPKDRKGAAGALDSEALRWNRAAAEVFARAPDAICVMDREADIFTLVAEMSRRGQPFVIRAAHLNRMTEEGQLWEQLDDTELITTREVKLPERVLRARKSRSEEHPPRSAHVARLELRSRRVKLKSPRNAPGGTKPSVELRLVHVIERNPPQGDPPIEWILFSNLPADETTDVELIVDAYHTRWLIEELFKALKSGCAFEKRQLETIRSVTNALAVYLPVSWLLLRLRHLARVAPERPAKAVLSPLMLACLHALFEKRAGQPFPKRPTCSHVISAIARLGGHIRNNGEPGFLVLGRGMSELLAAMQTAEALGWSPDL